MKLVLDPVFRLRYWVYPITDWLNSFKLFPLGIGYGNAGEIRVSSMEEGPQPYLPIAIASLHLLPGQERRNSGEREMRVQ